MGARIHNIRACLKDQVGHSVCLCSMSGGILCGTCAVLQESSPLLQDNLSAVRLSVALLEHLFAYGIAICCV